MISAEDLSRRMLRLRDAGCSNIEPVSPSHHLPGLLEAISLAAAAGVELPVVYNTNAYETAETMGLLEGVVDVYLPDLKYASDEIALKYSDVPDYVEQARAAILKMYAQVGNLVVDIHGRAVRGLILRHLVLPENLAGTTETLWWIRDNLPRTVTISLMAQYAPRHRSAGYPPLDRPVAPDEYQAAVDLAWDLGFENVFVQDLAAQEVGVPDFQLDQPFDWELVDDSGPEKL
jgi:putative pyruvate formate lyase activating enzyme